MNDNIFLPIGLCDIKYGNQTIFQGSDATFSAVPKYAIASYGHGLSDKRYFLGSYTVSFEVSVERETYETLCFSIPNIKKHEHGFFDNPSKVDTQGKRLVIHPYHAGENREYDICIWEAYIDPEMEVRRVFGKRVNSMPIRFLAKRVKEHKDRHITDSYFFIGDWSKVG